MILERVLRAIANPLTWQLLGATLAGALAREVWARAIRALRARSWSGARGRVDAADIHFPPPAPLEPVGAVLYRADGERIGELRFGGPGGGIPCDFRLTREGVAELKLPPYEAALQNADLSGMGFATPMRGLGSVRGVHGSSRAAESLGPCRICGCTTENCSGCVQRTGAPCWWVERDLCSACSPRKDP